MFNFINTDKYVLDSHERARIVALITDAAALLYHIFIFVFFLTSHVYQMAYYNIVSISVFTFLLAFIPKMKHFIVSYNIALVEVIVHQILADHFLGTQTCFHYFILLMGLLPYLIFENRFALSVPVTMLASLIFIILENINITPIIILAPNLIKFVRFINVFLTISIILLIILVYTIFVFKMEEHLKRQNFIFDREIKLASSIQQNFFKQDVTALERWDIGFCNQPMSGVSGDLYDIFKDGNVLEGFGIFDVSGHGISSGLVTMLVKNIIHQEFYNDKDLELWETLLNINDRIIEEKGDIENYLTGILARIKDTKTIEFVNASHPLPLVYRRATGEIEVLARRTEAMGAIGIKDFPTFYESQFVTLNEGDEFILYTDGVIDCLNKEKEDYGFERFKNAIKNVVDFKASEQIYLLLNDINDFRGAVPPNDDITIMIIRK